MGSRRPRMPGFGDDGGGRGALGRGGRPARGAFYPQQQYQQVGRGAYQPRGAMPPPPPQQWRPAGPAAERPAHNNGAGPSTTIAPELRQAMVDDDAPREPADAPASPGTGSPEAALGAVTEHLEALSVEGGGSPSSPPQALVVVQPPIPLPSDSYKFPHRPGSGRAGTRCLVKANHFLAELPDKDLHQYDVAITPETASRVVGRAVMVELVRLHKASYLGGRLPAYEGTTERAASIPGARGLE